MPESGAPHDVSYALGPALEFMRLLWSIQHSLQRMSKHMEGQLGITGPQRLVLRVIGQFPGVSAGELAVIVRLHPSTITGILQRLVQRGFVRRDRDPVDSRRVRLHLRPRAVSRIRSTPGTLEEVVTRALNGAGRSNVQAARGVLSDIARRLEERGRPTRRSRG